MPDLSSNLATAVAAHFQSYGTDYGSAYPFLGSSVGISPVSLSVPAYSNCGAAAVTDKGPNTVGVSIVSNCPGGLQASNEFMTVTESSADFQGDVPVNPFDLVSAAKLLFVDSNPVYGAIAAGASNTACRSVSDTEDSCGYDTATVGDTLLQAQCSDWQSKLEDSINTQLSGIQVAPLVASYSIVSMQAKYTADNCEVCTEVTSTSYTCTVDNCIPTTSCTGCTAGDPGCTCVPTHDQNGMENGESCESCTTTYDCAPPTTSDGACTDPCPGSSCTTNAITTKSYVTSCDYSYVADADVEVMLKAAPAVYYPIYHSTLNPPKTQWSQMQLKFVVLDGTLGGSRPSPSSTTTTTTTIPAPTLCPYSAPGSCADNAQGCGSGVCDQRYVCTSGTCCCPPRCSALGSECNSGCVCGSALCGGGCCLFTSTCYPTQQACGSACVGTTTTIAAATTTTVPPSCSQYSNCGSCTTGGCMWWTCLLGSGCGTIGSCGLFCSCYPPSTCGGAGVR